MKQTTIIITTIVVATIVFTMLATTFWILWTKEKRKLVVQSTTPSQQVGIKREDFKEALVEQLKIEYKDFGYDSYEIEPNKEDEKWIRGLLIGYHEGYEDLADPYEFFAIKNSSGEIIDFSYTHNEKFKGWLPQIPENILPQNARPFYE